MTSDNKPILYIVIPCYNEEKVLPITRPMFVDQLADMEKQGLISGQSKVLFVNDGSSDRTWELISEYAEEDEHIAGVCLSRNRGHQNALVCGLMEARLHADVTISIDCDGQDDISVMTNMVRKHLDGCDIVYGVRKARDTDTAFKRMTAQGFYKVMEAMGADTIYNHADYRLVSKRALDAFADFHEVNLFLRGMFPLVGFKTDCVYYDRAERIAGESHYPLSKMVSLAVDGITSMSVKPLRLVTAIGCAVSFAGLVTLVVCAIMACMGGASGLACLGGLLCLLSGAQTVAIGVVGEYVGKCYMEVKARPRYIVSQRVGL